MKEDLDDIIQDILDEDEYVPKFEEASGDDKASTKVAEKDTSSKKSNLYKKNTKNVVKNKESNDNKKKNDYAKMAIMITRYLILGCVVLFFMSLFFNWFSLSGNAVNYGFIRTEATTEFLEMNVQPHKVADLESYSETIVTFSGDKLNKFSDVIEADYMTTTGPAGDEVKSIASLIHKYYMKSLVWLFVFTIIAALILAIFRGYKGIAIVRNLAVLNAIIVGLNYMALKVSYFSMFAIRAKDVLNQSTEHMTLSMTKDGIAVDKVFYPYVLTEERGLYFALFFLGAWLVLSIILSEVKNREEEIAIENGEID